MRKNFNNYFLLNYLLKNTSICFLESSEKRAVSDAIDILNDVGITNWPSLNESFIFTNLAETLGKLAAFGEFAFVNFKPSPYKRNIDDSNQRPPVLVSILYVFYSGKANRDVFYLWCNCNILINISVTFKT